MKLGFVVILAMPWLPAPSKEGLSSFGSGLGVFPVGATVYGRVLRPGHGYEYEQSRLREAGLFALASALEDQFFRDRTETRSSLHPFGDSFGYLLNASPREAKRVYLAAAHDWGRGQSLESTRKALAALHEGEFAIYPQGKTIQALHGDTSVWLALLRERGPVKTIGSLGRVNMFEIDSGDRARYVALLPSRTALRSTDIDLLRRTVTLATSDSLAGSLRNTPSIRELMEKAPADSTVVLAVDLAAVQTALVEMGKVSAPVSVWLREFLRGSSGLGLYQQNKKLRFQFLCEPGAPLRTLLEGESLRDSFPGVTEEKVVGSFAVSLSLSKIFAALRDRPSEESGAPDGLAPGGIARMLQNLSFGQSLLWSDKNGCSAICIPFVDPAMGETATAFLQGMIALSGSPVSLARYESFLVVAQDRDCLEEALDSFRVNPRVLDRSALRDFFSISPAGEITLDLAPLFSAWNGEISARVLVSGSGMRPASWLRFELGLLPEAYRKIGRIVETLRANSPAWKEKLDRYLRENTRGLRRVGDFDSWVGAAEGWAFSASADRVRLDLATDLLGPALSSEAVVPNAPSDFVVLVETGLRQKSRAIERSVKNISCEMSSSLEPIYEELIRNPTAFRNYCFQAARRASWPWYAMRSEQRLTVSRGSLGPELVMESGDERVALWMLTAFFDRYVLSDPEERAMLRVFAIENAQRIFSSLRLKDMNRNGVGDFASLVEILDASATGVSSRQIFPSAALSGENWTEDGYVYRLLLPKDPDEIDRRWCLFAFPQKPDFDRKLAFFIDERGFLLVGLQPDSQQTDNAQMEFFRSQLTSISTDIFALAKPQQFREFCTTSKEPPEHRRIYEYFLPFFSAYARGVSAESGGK